jgi:hypothetical protein
MLSKRYLLFVLSLIFILPMAISCSATKDVEQRRNYMIPKKSDLPANSRYKEPGKRKTYTHKPPSSKRKSYF